MSAQDIHRRLGDLLARKEPNSLEKTEIKDLINQLFETPEGRDIVKGLTTPEPKQTLRKFFCEMVVNQLKTHLKDLPEEGGEEALEVYVDILQGIVMGQNSDMYTKWVSLRLLLDVRPRTGRDLFQEALDGINPKKDIIQRYDQFVRNYMGPDAGLQVLKDVAESGFERPWLSLLIREAERWAQKNEDIWRAGASRVERGIQPRTRLTDLSGTPTGQGQAFEQGGRDSLSGGPRTPSPVEFLSYLESGIHHLRNIAREHEAFQDRIKELEHQIVLHVTETSRLKNENSELKAQRDQLERERDENLEKLKRTQGELESTKRRAEQDVNMARAEKRSEVKTFSHKLWQRLEDSFIEVVNPSLDIKNKPPSERLLLLRLKNILDDLRSLGVVSE